MDAFHGGSASTLVATDIAARGIHVDDVGLVVHADPPVEHKAYLHRSGRTARAGAAGTVITLMTADQVADVRDLTRKAGIKPRTTRLDATHPLLREVAPGERLFPGPLALAPSDTASQGQGGRPARGPARRTTSGEGRGTAAEGSGRGRRSGGTGRRQGSPAAGSPTSGSQRGGSSTSGSQRGGSPKSGSPKSGSQRSGSQRAGSGRSGSATVYSTSSGGGGAAAFSARSRSGSGRAR
jgi:superfamily II DNA/RNA helicase